MYVNHDSVVRLMGMSVCVHDSVVRLMEMRNVRLDTSLRTLSRSLDSSIENRFTRSYCDLSFLFKPGSDFISGTSHFGLRK